MRSPCRMTGGDERCNVLRWSGGGMWKEVGKQKRLDVTLGFDAGLSSSKVAQQVCIGAAFNDYIGPRIGNMKLASTRSQQGCEVARNKGDLRGHLTGSPALRSSAVGLIASGSVCGKVREKGLHCRSIASHRSGRSIRTRHRRTQTTHQGGRRRAKHH